MPSHWFAVQAAQLIQTIKEESAFVILTSLSRTKPIPQPLHLNVFAKLPLEWFYPQQTAYLLVAHPEPYLTQLDNVNVIGTTQHLLTKD